MLPSYIFPCKDSLWEKSWISLLHWLVVIFAKSESEAKSEGKYLCINNEKTWQARRRRMMKRVRSHFLAILLRQAEIYTFLP